MTGGRGLEPGNPDEDLLASRFMCDVGDLTDPDEIALFSEDGSSAGMNVLRPLPAQISFSFTSALIRRVQSSLSFALPEGRSVQMCLSLSEL